MEEQLFLYYTSDLHSYFNNWPKIVSFLKEKQAQRLRDNQHMILLDNGDHIDRVHPVSEALLGQGNVALLNEANYDVVTIGNNEGITLDHDSLYHLYDDANFSVVCANIHSSDGNNPNWLHSTTYRETNSGLTIGIIGLTAPFYAFYEPLHWTIEDPFAALDREIEQLTQKADIIVLLSHLGINDDERIATSYPMIDVIIGGHTHHLFRNGEIINKSILTAAGKYGHYVGEVILTWDHDQNKLINKQAYATQIDHFSEDKESKQLISEQTKRSTTLLNQPIATLANSLNIEWYKTSLIMQQLTDILLDWTKADFAMLNAGLLLNSLPKGVVNYADIHRICPHPINPCVVTITGQELLEVIREVLTKRFMNLEVQGYGFRGKVIGKMVFSGLEIKSNRDSDGNEQVTSVMHNQQPLIMNKIYYLATADMFTFGHLSPQIARSTSKQFFMPEFIRDLLIKTLVKYYCTD
ncbi:Endonuclease YhcR precursor [Paraliobacillus sp. PM-2]|uniref:bifunctional metallophosphatase/5'-nucleotidase n=1 Tax=Paraliobacillus sp. PM-2 TaxID=1462524 RepID=UPI00061C118C|nr:bifunctional UDP-sugar hydrolase/5'-nucleotidase [Paraliobacillus sp. PM-2]CQR46549.1 Endonuclease YhcR precursor [Paraliobacillus sp. PM-2]